MERGLRVLASDTENTDTEAAADTRADTKDVNTDTEAAQPEGDGEAAQPRAAPAAEEEEEMAEKD